MFLDSGVRKTKNFKQKDRQGKKKGEWLEDEVKERLNKVYRGTHNRTGH